MSSDSDNPMRLRDVLPDADYFPAGVDPSFVTVHTEASDVEPGDLFVHLDEFDSADAEAAATRGACAVVAERLLPEVDAPQVLVDDCQDALRALHGIATQPVNAGPIRVHVAGVCGASRAATLLAAIHASAGERVGLLTEHCEDDGEHCLPRRPGSKRGPEWWTKRCRLGGVTTAVAALSPDVPADQHALVACLTTLRGDGADPAGLPRWPSPQRHTQAILAALGEVDSGVTLVVNGDEPEATRLGATHRGRMLTFGESDAVDVRVTLVAEQPAGQEIIVTAGGDSACVALATPGRAARRDAAAAIATSLVCGFDLAGAVRGVDLAPVTPLTLETITVGQAFPVYLDAAASPFALADALEGARAGADRVLVALRLADDRGVARRQLATAGKMADRVLAHGDATGLGPLPEQVTVVEDRLAALAVVLGLADAGDAVLLAGARDAQNDKETASKLLRRRQACEGRRAAA